MPRLTQAEDWRAVRALRLRALADAPDAFEMTLAQAEQWTDEEWRRRVAEGDERLIFVEEDVDRNFVGMAVGLFEPAARVVHLVGMFVEPGRRRAGLGRGLVEAVESGRFREPTPIGFYFAKLWYFERMYPLVWTVMALGRARQSMHTSSAASR